MQRTSWGLSHGVSGGRGVKQVGKTKRQKVNYKISYGAVMYSTGNIVSNTALVLYGDRRLVD